MVWLSVENFGTFKDEPVKKFTWGTEKGVTISAISYGAIITSIQVPDRNGTIADVVLGFNDLEGYLKKNTPYFGAVVGRCANRIAGGKFHIDNATYTLAKNAGENHLHGGRYGFDKKNWLSKVDGTKVIFSYLSEDCEEGYPGSLVTNVTYDVTDDGSLHVEFLATTTKETVVNLTNHSYFNLAGHDTGAEELLKHEVVVDAERITETDEDSIPTGNFTDVSGTDFDLRTCTKLGDVITKNPKLFDNNFCITTYGNQGLNFAARVTHPPSGRYLEVSTDQPGVQLYTSYYLPAPCETALLGKAGAGYRRHGAFCLETQNYPDAVNHPNFPSANLKPGQVYRHRVKYSFGIDCEPYVTAS